MSRKLRLLLFSLVGFFILFISCRDSITETPTEDKLTPGHSHGSIQIISPAKWELWRQNKSYEIRWNSSLENNDLKIELIKKDVVKLLISSITEDDGLFSWQIPINVINSNMYQIKITSLTNSTKYVMSQEFSIRDF